MVLLLMKRREGEEDNRFWPTRSQSEAHQWLLPLLPPSKWTDTDASGGRWQQEIIFISRCHLSVESSLSWSLLIISSATANLSQQVDGYSKNITRPLSSNFFTVASALSFFRQNRTETIGCNPGTVSAPNLHRDLQTGVLSIFNHGHSFASLSIASSLGHVCGSLCLNVINGRLLSFNVLVQLPHC